MFYVLDNENHKIILEDCEGGNVHTDCVDCGRRLDVDLKETLATADADLYSTGIRCHECSLIHARNHASEPWAQQILAEAGELDSVEVANPRKTPGEVAAFEDGYDQGIRFAQHKLKECISSL